jgi:hypothetical protein
MQKGGFDVYQDLNSAALCGRLLGEAWQCSAFAQPSEISFSDNEEVRGGQPARRFLSAPGGQVQAGFYHAPDVIGFLQSICNAAVAPTGALGTYTYYACPGDHLSLHRDIETCDVAVVTCLLDRHKCGGCGGLTRLYPQRQREPLSHIRASPNLGAVTTRVAVGQTMVMFGGLVPHAILPLGVGELRVVSVLCYRVCLAGC